MSDNLGAAYVEVRGDMSKLPADLSGAGGVLKQAFAGFGVSGAAEGLAGVAAGFVGIAAPAALAAAATQIWTANAQAATKAANEQYEADLRLAAALDATGHAAGLSFETLKKQADTLQSATGVADETIEAFQQQLLNFDKVQGETFKRATHAALEMAESTGRSMPAMATTLGRALSDPVRGMQRLERQGVMLSESQKKMVKDFMEAGKTAEAQGIILDALEKKYGDFAERTMNPLKRLKVELSELEEKLGELYRQREPLEIQAKIIAVGFQFEVEKELSRIGTELGQLFGEGVKASDVGTFIGRMASFQIMAGFAAAFPGLSFLMNTNKLMNAGNNPATRPDTGPKRQGPGDANVPSSIADKGNQNGFFDPVALFKSMQTSRIGDWQAQLVDLARAQRDIQQRQLDLAMGRKGDAGEAIQVEGPR